MDVVASGFEVVGIENVRVVSSFEVVELENVKVVVGGFVLVVCC